MIFRKNSVTDQVAYSNYGTDLLFVDSYKVLGKMIDFELNLHAHIIDVIEEAGAVDANLLRRTVNRTVEFLLALYGPYIRPAIDYRSCVWNIGYLEHDCRLERLQRDWTREFDDFTGLKYVSCLKKISLDSIKGRPLRVDLIRI